MTGLQTALDNYAATVLGAVAPLALVAVVALALILLAYGAARR